ncbi:MAG TPA: hypothetical protein VN649_12790 [Ramlibacter sp.]|nr:hypothetical protein [Ramlibacter sp.]
MTPTRDDVAAAAQAEFPGSDLPTVLAVLDLFGTEPHEREKERVQLAILQLSGGSEDRLLYLVQAAKTDYRDVLAWQQLGPLSAPEGDKLQGQARDLLEKWGRK